MRLIPKSKSDTILFFSSHLPKWSENWSAIGLSEAAVAELAAQVADADGKLLAQRQAENRAMCATAAANDAIAAMAQTGSDMIKAIRAKAAAAEGNEVYHLAQIPPPKAPSPVNTLGTPGSFAVKLSQVGTLTLTWKCKNPRASGTVYQVWRSVDGASFTFVGATGEKRFADDTIPAGAARVVYRVQAMRSTASGPCATFSVNFGGGGRSESFVPAGKMAA